MWRLRLIQKGVKLGEVFFRQRQLRHHFGGAFWGVTGRVLGAQHAGLQKFQRGAFDGWPYASIRGGVGIVASDAMGKIHLTTAPDFRISIGILFITGRFNLQDTGNQGAYQKDPPCGGS